ncbi:MAG: aldo/keto reductase [Anaerolineaceae bacterium]
MTSTDLSGSPVQSILSTVQLGFGTWSWGDRLFWGFGTDYSDSDLKAAFETALSFNLTFFDTAETYGQGKSESFLGEFVSTASQPVIVATKFAPLPWRITKKSLIHALKQSLTRLGLPQVDLYQIHMPLPPVSIRVWMEALCESVDMGLTREIGVSNFDLLQTRLAYETLARWGKHLASNQVEFNLLNRNAETSGILNYCKENQIRMIAYSPLAQGVLSGKYTPEHLPLGVRGRRYTAQYLANIQPLINLLKKIGANHNGKSPSQVSLNWVISKGALPIPGIKNSAQVEQNAGALGWSLTEDEIIALDEMSQHVSNHG